LLSGAIYLLPISDLINLPSLDSLFGANYQKHQHATHSTSTGRGTKDQAYSWGVSSKTNHRNLRTVGDRLTRSRSDFRRAKTRVLWRLQSRWSKGLRAKSCMCTPISTALCTYCFYAVTTLDWLRWSFRIPSNTPNPLDSTKAPWNDYWIDHMGTVSDEEMAHGEGRIWLSRKHTLRKGGWFQWHLKQVM